MLWRFEFYNHYCTVGLDLSCGCLVMARHKFLSPRGHFKNLLPQTAFWMLWIFIAAQPVLTALRHQKMMPTAAFLMTMLGIFLLIRLWTRKPPLTCQGCGAAGWPSDLDKSKPVCPHCSSGHFNASGKYKDTAAPYVGTVLGIDIVSGTFSVDGAHAGDCGDSGGDCGGGDGGGGGD